MKEIARVTKLPASGRRPKAILNRDEEQEKSASQLKNMLRRSEDVERGKRATNIRIRKISPKDLEPCSVILYQSFTELAGRYGLPSDFPSMDYASNSMKYLLQHKSVYGAVAEAHGRAVGFSFVYERDSIRAIGPLCVSPVAQGTGVGRELVKAMLHRCKGSVGVRLVTDTFNTRSLPLYISMGFTARDTTILMRGETKRHRSQGYVVRPLSHRDIDACTSLCRKVHGIERTNELSESIATLNPYVAVKGGNVVAYTTTLTRWHRGHSVARNDEDMGALINGVSEMEGKKLAFLMPLSQSCLFAHCLEWGFEVVKPMTLMSMGMYKNPGGTYMPSVLY